jgi:hypothetical protein
MAEWIVESATGGTWRCICGNTEDHEGFPPYREGREVEPSDPDWNGHDVACRRCRRVINGWQATDAPDGSIRLPVIDRPDAIVWLED